MSSILTNTSSMVALQTLRGINNNLSKTQSLISTGKEINSARDNASVWAVSKVMESDIGGFKAISQSLALGNSTLGVASNAAETVENLLKQMKAKIITGQEENIPREEVQTDIEALTGQINSIVEAAQFNGLNLVKGQEDVSILSSLDRAPGGTVSASYIDIQRQDLTGKAGVYGTGADLSGNVAIADAATAVSAADNAATITIGTPAIGDSFTATIDGITVGFTAASTLPADVAAGLAAAINAEDAFKGISATAAGADVVVASSKAFEGVKVEAASSNTAQPAVADGDIPARAESVTFAAAAVSDGDGYRVTLGGATFDYVAGRGETMENVARGLKMAIDAAKMEGISTKVTQDSASGQWSLQVDNSIPNLDTSSPPVDQGLAIAVEGTAGGEATGGLYGLNDIDVTTNDGAKAALQNIETLMETARSAAAEFGSAAGRMDTQMEFVTNMIDSLTSGVGALVDADMEAASARLQALQVQQQLGVQALSIANQAPQTILSLFR